VPEPLLLCYESPGLESGDDEEASSSSRERAAPSSRVLDFFLVSELECGDDCSLESGGQSSPDSPLESLPHCMACFCVYQVSNLISNSIMIDRSSHP
jgi:hypothetical protein